MLLRGSGIWIEAWKSRGGHPSPRERCKAKGVGCMSSPEFQKPLSEKLRKIAWLSEV